MAEWSVVMKAVKSAEARMKQLKAKCPDLSGYLVFSLPTGQTAIDSSPEGVVGEFPDMVTDSSAKTEAIELAAKIQRLRADNKEPRKEDVRALQPLLDKLTYRDNVNIEIRFKVIRYAVVRQLRTDPLIDREQTPQKAGIRLVIGTIGALARD